MNTAFSVKTLILIHVSTMTPQLTITLQQKFTKNILKVPGNSPECLHACPIRNLYVNIMLDMATSALGGYIATSSSIYSQKEGRAPSLTTLWTLWAF